MSHQSITLIFGNSQLSQLGVGSWSIEGSKKKPSDLKLFTLEIPAHDADCLDSRPSKSIFFSKTKFCSRFRDKQHVFG